MTSKQRSYLKSLAMNLEPIFHIGKASLTDEIVEELIKIGVLKNCTDDIKEIANAIATHTDSELVQIIGKKIVIYKEAYEPEKRKIKLPKVKAKV